MQAEASAILGDDTPRTAARETSNQTAIVTLTSMSLDSVQQGIPFATGTASREAIPARCPREPEREELAAAGHGAAPAHGSCQVRAIANTAALQQFTPRDQSGERPALDRHHRHLPQIPLLTPGIPERMVNSDAPQAGYGLDQWGGRTAKDMAALYATHLATIQNNHASQVHGHAH